MSPWDDIGESDEEAEYYSVPECEECGEDMTPISDSEWRCQCGNWLLFDDGEEADRVVMHCPVCDTYDGLPRWMVPLFRVCGGCGGSFSYFDKVSL